ncbi:MAG: winged helix-turn-helix domain-containing protein [Nitrospirota bacterium]
MIAGFNTDLWTCPRVAKLIEKLFGVHYHAHHVSKLL